MGRKQIIVINLHQLTKVFEKYKAEENSLDKSTNYNGEETNYDNQFTSAHKSILDIQCTRN